MPKIHMRDVRVLGPNVRQRREALGLTIEAVAERASVPAGWLVRLERSEVVDPDIRGLERLADSLDTTLLTLLTTRARS